MGKTKPSKRPTGGNTTWDAEKHANRLSKKLKQEQPQDNSYFSESDNEDGNNSKKKTKKKTKSKKKKCGKYERSALLSHDNAGTKEKDKIRLNISKTKRQVQRLKGNQR